MNALSIIWCVALGLALGALAWMTGLILLRITYTRAAARRAADRRQVEQALLAVLQGRGDVAAALGPYRSRARLMAEVLLDFATILRGDDWRRIVDALDHEGVPAVLRARTRRGSVAGRLASIEALGVFPGPETRAALSMAAARGAEAVRLAALRSLSQAGGEVSVTRLVDGLRTGTFRRSGALADLMRMLVASDPAAGFAALAREDTPPAAQALLLEALAAAGDYAALAVIMDHAQGPDAAVRAAAVRALGALRHPAAEPALGRALADADWEVRAAAAEAIGDSRLTAIAASLVEALDDGVWRVRFQAAAALAKLGPPGLQLLRAAAEAEPGFAQRAAAMTLLERRAA